MVLILPEADRRSHRPSGLTTAGLQASIVALLSDEADGHPSRLHVRVLGSYVIIEGLIDDEERVPEIVALAEEVAGVGNVRVCVFRH